ncbi:hypothetical protein FRC17_007081 [Serendipita sp. 399]|nr:hypothetical protein FRC17_007081 [Serendipita sp. 399]
MTGLQDITAEIGKYIQNYLPIRLLRVSDMTLVGRTLLQGEVNKALGEHQRSCLSEECNYLEDLKEELRYSILSHRWGDGEVVFHHFQTLHQQVVGMPNPPGFKDKLLMLRNYVPSASEAASESSLVKLAHFLKVSAEKQCKFAWMDTICINKESSTELDESIRSMFAWYRDSHICIVYLSETNSRSDLKQDPWFGRGWTLQELLAPRRFAFYSKNWKQITRSDCEKHSGEQARRKGIEERLWADIASITQIKVEDIHNFKPGMYDIRKRMAWAARRQTMRIEDMAYCLLGIFNVNLSIAYGEKDGAFYRLQLEILQNCPDLSLFDWEGQASGHNSMFASSPACFRSNRAVHIITWPHLDTDTAWTYTNLGVRIQEVLYKLNQGDVERLSLHPDAVAFAFPGDPQDHDDPPMLILGEGDRPGQYVRLGLIEGRHIHSSHEELARYFFVK